MQRSYYNVEPRNLSWVGKQGEVVAESMNSMTWRGQGLFTLGC